MTKHESLLRAVEEINGVHVVRFCDLQDPALHNGKSALLTSALASIAKRDPPGLVLDFECIYFTPSATILTVLVKLHRGLDAYVWRVGSNAFESIPLAIANLFHYFWGENCRTPAIHRDVLYLRVSLIREYVQ